MKDTKRSTSRIQEGQAGQAASIFAEGVDPPEGQVVSNRDDQECRSLPRPGQSRSEQLVSI